MRAQLTDEGQLAVLQIHQSVISFILDHKERKGLSPSQSLLFLIFRFRPVKPVLNVQHVLSGQFNSH